MDTWLRTQALRDLGATAQWILVDPGEAVTLRRATRDRRPQASIDAIHKWYRDPPVPPCRTSQPAESNADLGQVLGDWW